MGLPAAIITRRGEAVISFTLALAIVALYYILFVWGWTFPEFLHVGLRSASHEKGSISIAFEQPPLGYRRFFTPARGFVTLVLMNRGVAQGLRAPALGAGGRTFKSCRPDTCKRAKFGMKVSETYYTLAPLI